MLSKSTAFDRVRVLKATAFGVRATALPASMQQESVSPASPPPPPAPAAESPTDPASPAVATPQRQPAAKPATRSTTSQPLPLFHVILLDDDDHTYQYVSDMLGSVFGYPQTKGMKFARQVDTQGRAIVMTTHKELAELKRDLIMGFGADPQISSSRSGMRAVIEAAPK